MTRINLVPPSELSDQHLIAEYRELPRCLKQDINIFNAPLKYCLGKGHMKWARRHWSFIFQRFKLLVNEMKFRNFKVSNKYLNFLELSKFKPKQFSLEEMFYSIDITDLILSRNRLIEKFKQKPSFYRWTNRERPAYMENKNESKIMG